MQQHPDPDAISPVSYDLAALALQWMPDDLLGKISRLYACGQSDVAEQMTAAFLIDNMPRLRQAAQQWGEPF